MPSTLPRHQENIEVYCTHWRGTPLRACEPLPMTQQPQTRPAQRSTPVSSSTGCSQAPTQPFRSDQALPAPPSAHRSSQARWRATIAPSRSSRPTATSSRCAGVPAPLQPVVEGLSPWLQAWGCPWTVIGAVGRPTGGPWTAGGRGGGWAAAFTAAHRSPALFRCPPAAAAGGVCSRGGAQGRAGGGGARDGRHRAGSGEEGGGQAAGGADGAQDCAGRRPHLPGLCGAHRRRSSADQQGADRSAEPQVGGWVGGQLGGCGGLGGAVPVG